MKKLFICKIGIHKYNHWITTEIIDDGLKSKERHCKHCGKKHEGTFGFLLTEPIN